MLTSTHQEILDTARKILADYKIGQPMPAIYITAYLMIEILEALEASLTLMQGTIQHEIAKADRAYWQSNRSN